MIVRRSNPEGFLMFVAGVVGATIGIALAGFCAWIEGRMKRR